MNKAVSKIFLEKSPGRDLIKGYWYKRLSFYKKHLLKLFQETYEGMLDLPNWLTLAQNTLLPKNQDTKNAKHYRPIACIEHSLQTLHQLFEYFSFKTTVKSTKLSLQSKLGKKEVYGDVPNSSLLTKIF